MTSRIRQPKPALIVAILALVVALSGTAFAAVATLKDGDTLIARHSLSGNRLRAGTVTSTQMSKLAWGGIILQNGWTHGARLPKAAMDAQGIVHLQGAVRGGKATTIGTLPKSDAPAAKIYLTGHDNKGETVGIILQSNGAIILQSALGPNMFVGLDGLTYAR